MTALEALAFSQGSVTAKAQMTCLSFQVYKMSNSSELKEFIQEA